MKLVVTSLIIAVVLIVGVAYLVGKGVEPELPINNNGEISELVQCLADAGVVIYGSVTCPACAQMASGFGGYAAMGPIYVECTENQLRCQQEMQTNYVPEVQINGTPYNGPRTPKALARETGC